MNPSIRVRPSLSLSTFIVASLLLAGLAPAAHAQRRRARSFGIGTVQSHQKISSTSGGFAGVLNNRDGFGVVLTRLGDLDGDGVTELAVGSYLDDDGGTDVGAVWVLFMDRTGGVRQEQKISATAGGFTGQLDSFDDFAVPAAIGDLDGDGNVDLACGAEGDDDGGSNRGALWILFLNSDGTVAWHQKISAASGGFTGALSNGDRFGWSVSSLGDLDGDGVTDLAVGALFDDDGGTNTGAVWILFLNSDGTVKSDKKISDPSAAFLSPGDEFGFASAPLGDLDGDGVVDLAVGATRDDDGGLDRGATWVLFLNSDGTVRAMQKISSTAGGFRGTLDDVDRWGVSLANLGDIDADGVVDLAVGALFDDDGGTDVGALWVLTLSHAGTITKTRKISATHGGFSGQLDSQDYFAEAMAPLGDLDGDGIGDLAVGAWSDDDGGLDRGAVWILFLDGIPW